MFELAVGFTLLVAARTRSWVLLALVLLAAAAWLKTASITGQSMNGGWGIQNLAVGAPRTLTSFLMGICVHRFWVWLEPRLFFPLIVLLNIKTKMRAGSPWLLLGELSYPIYVLHVPMYMLVEKCLSVAGVPRASASVVVTAIAATLVVAHVMAKYYDKPLRAWLKSRFEQPSNGLMTKGTQVE